MKDQTSQHEPNHRGLGYWAAATVTGVLCLFLAMLITLPIAVAGGRMTESSPEAAILFAVCYYGLCLVLAIGIFRRIVAGRSQKTLSAKKMKPKINYIWPFIGLGLGTTIFGSLVLSTDPLDRLSSGLVMGGVPLGLLGLAYALYRRRQDCRTSELPEPLDAPLRLGDN